MKENSETKAFYDRLRQQLQDDTEWPASYMFKFIVPASLEKIAEIEAVFNHSDAVFNTRDSSKGNYTSVSITVTMQSPDEVVEKYLEVSKVDGVISL